MITPAKQQNSARRIDERSVMASILLFVIAAPPEATAVASLHEDCVNIFIRCLNSTNADVSL